jgi:CubicO group peptidase (beta-lactamase class C family)
MASGATSRSSRLPTLRWRRRRARTPDYGFLWWLNTKQAQWPGSPGDAFSARGSGGNIIFISPGHDLVVVWRWGAQSNEGFKRVVAAITS